MVITTEMITNAEHGYHKTKHSNELDRSHKHRPPFSDRNYETGYYRRVKRHSPTRESKPSTIYRKQLLSTTIPYTHIIPIRHEKSKKNRTHVRFLLFSVGQLKCFVLKILAKLEIIKKKAIPSILQTEGISIAVKQY